MFLQWLLNAVVGAGSTLLVIVGIILAGYSFYRFVKALPAIMDWLENHGTIIWGMVTGGIFSIFVFEIQFPETVKNGGFLTLEYGIYLLVFAIIGGIISRILFSKPQ